MSSDRKPSNNLPHHNLAIRNHLQPTKTGYSLDPTPRLRPRHRHILPLITDPARPAINKKLPPPLALRSPQRGIINTQFAIAAPGEIPRGVGGPGLGAGEDEVREVAVHYVVIGSAEAVEVDERAGGKVLGDEEEDVGV